MRVADAKRGKTCASGHVTTGFGFTSDWMIKWREFSKPITQHGNSKPTQMRITFDHFI